ncbi:MAG: hypothetical protein M1814_003936 [Vezdaea aestivalis]|nr:MAG: hypothetical protein M1814_003936 [Vezdaea aestivalis]
MAAIAGNENSNAPRPRALAPEKVAADGLKLLSATVDVDEKKGLSPEQLAEIISNYDALIVRSETKVTADLISKGTNLKVIARAGVGVDNVDVQAASRAGVIVVNSPAGNIGAAAEHTIALMLAVARNVPDGCASLKAGRWERSRLVGVEMNQKALGIIGLGKVGLKVARMAAGMGMSLHALDPYASPAIASAAGVTLHTSLASLLAVADFLTIHTPLVASTKGMIGEKELASMKKGARILNVARGGMIEEVALLSALESGHIAGAGLDVFSEEPPKEGGDVMKLISHPKVVATPHLGASTVEAQLNVSMDVCESVSQILAGSLPRSAVNAPLILPDEYKKLQPFVALVEKMGALYTQHYHPHRSGSSMSASSLGTSFDLVYEGEITSLTNTKPLYTALVKGLTSGVTDGGAAHVSIVNADMVARERGLVISETNSRDPVSHTYSSLVTLRARSSRSTSQERLATEGTASQPQEQVISGYCSDAQIFIARLDRFSTRFVPKGNLLILRNYDSPGKIGAVGGLLGEGGVNIGFMSVAPLAAGQSSGGSAEQGKVKSEALMILGVDAEVSTKTVEALKGVEGILDVSSLNL